MPTGKQPGPSADGKEPKDFLKNYWSEVLIIRTERVESPARLWRLGRSLARSESLLWLPGLLSRRPDRFRALVLAALDISARAGSPNPGRGSRRIRSSAARTGPALLTP